jgi:hypothetical protein
MKTSDPFEECVSYAFRLELLPAYLVSGSNERFDKYKRTGTLSDGANRGWADTISKCVQRGCRVMRLRALSTPISAYEEYEIKAGYRDGIRAGEEIHTISRADISSRQDFWAFDDKLIRRMNYDEKGRYIGSDTEAMSASTRAEVARLLGVFHESTPVVVLRP